MIVMKFGGTSVEDAALSIDRAASLARENRDARSLSFQRSRATNALLEAGRLAADVNLDRRWR